MQNCKQCKYRLSSYGSNFYCCNKQQPVCSSCRIQPCKICKQRRLNILQPPKCMVCWGQIYNGKGYTDKNCGKQFCPKCLAKTFKDAYQKILAPSRYSIQGDQQNFRLPCGDNCHLSDLVYFFKDYCLQCGKDYRETLDFDLKDGLKLCFMCESYFRDKYSNAFIKCNICGCSIEKKSKAGISDESDFILCKNCFFESQAEEKYIEKNKQLNESRKKSESFFKQKQQAKIEERNLKEQSKKSQLKIDTNFTQEKSSISFVQKKFQQSFSETKAQAGFIQKKSEQHIKEFREQRVSSKKSSQQSEQEKKLQKRQISEVSPLRKIIEKTWIPSSQKDLAKEQTNLKPKDETKSKPASEQKVQSVQKQVQKIQQPQSENQKLQTTKQQQRSHEYFVTNQLINQEEQVDEQVKKQLGIENGLFLKKYLSDETLVENLTLEIPSVSLNTFVKCKECNIKLPIKLAYNLDPKTESKQKSSSLLCISSIEESLSQSRTKDSNFSCRVCYQKIFDVKSKKKPIFYQSVSIQDRSFMTNSFYRSVLEDSRKTSDLLRDSYLSRRKDVGQSIKKSHVSPYGLTGAKLQEHRTITQNLKSSLNESLRRPSTPLKPTHQKIRLTANEFKPQRRTNEKYSSQKCVYCGLPKEGLIYSLDGGKYCTECHVKKNRLLYSDHTYLKNYLLRP